MTTLTTAQRRYQKLRAEKRCADCRCESPDRGVCRECAAKREANRLALHNARLQLGLCTVCGGETDGGWRLCGKCRERQRDRWRKAQGLA